MTTQSTNGLKSILLFIAMFVSSGAISQSVVNSLEDLLPYLKQDDVHVKLAPGAYTISGEDAANGIFGSEIFEAGRKTLLLFEGSNSSYDFTGVTINVETKVFTSIGKFKVYELQTIGNNNVIKNLTLMDIGSVHDAATVGVISVVMDGANNRIEGMNLSTKGSFPYGYGEIFGKGGPSVIEGIKKHSAFLIRGYANHAKNCSIIHRAYGHAYVMQAADKPLIEGCYAEGEMRDSDEILAEKGSGSIADKANFMTYFGYPLPPGYKICTGEEGIRAYNTGRTYINGEIIKRGTSNPTILNCTIKNLRAGVTLTHATGKKHVKGCTAIGCNRGFCIGSGDIIDCYADCQHGPALGVDYETDEGMNAEVTLLPYNGEPYNGSKHAAIIIGSNHNIVLKSKVNNPDQDLKINIGGDNRTIGLLSEDENYQASNIRIDNQSNYPIVLDENSKYCSGKTKGKLIDYASNKVIHAQCDKQ